MAAEDVNAVARVVQTMSDSDLEFLERVADEAQNVSGDSARDLYAGDGHRLPATGPYVFSGAHGTMAAINVGDDEADIPSAQPYPIDVSDDSLIGYVAAEPGRQSDDDGSGTVKLAADSVDARGLGVDAHVSDSVDSAGAIGVAADADGLWAASSLAEGATAEIPLTQVYADEGVAVAQSLANMPALEVDPIANMPALQACNYDDSNMPALQAGSYDDCGSPSVASASVVCSEAESSASTAAPKRGDLPCVTYFPTFSSKLVPRCQKCGREVDPLKCRQTRQVDGNLPGGHFKCKACNVRHVQAVGLFGEWPNDDFLELDEKSQEAFWCAPGKTKADLEANVKKHVIRLIIKRRTAASKGSYQPISWYERQGYDVARIVDEITDTKVMKGLGLCYKVFVEEETFESIDEMCSKKLKDMKKEKHSIRAEKKERAIGASASATAVAPGCKRGRSSSSDSSSSTRRHRKERKAERRSAEKRKAAEVEVTPEELAEQTAAKEKEQKLADKEAAKVEKIAQAEAKKNARIAEQAERKAVKDRKAAATKMALKLTPAIRNLQGGLADPEIQHVPAFTLVAAKKSLAECLEIFEEMQQKKGEENPAVELDHDILDVEELSKVALRDAKAVNAGLALVYKLRNMGNEES